MHVKVPRDEEVHTSAPSAETRAVRRSRRRRIRPPWLDFLLGLLLWLLTAGLLVVVLARLVAWDRFEPFAVLNTITVFVPLPAWFVLVVAAVSRRLFLGLAAMLVVVAQIAFLLPELAA